MLRAQQPGSQVDQLRAQTERHRQEASAAREQEATAQRQLRAERAALDAQIARFAPPAARVAGPATIVSARRISVNGREVLLANINDFRVPPFPMLREALQALGGSVECIETNSGENLFNCRAAGRDLAELFVLNGLAIVAASTRPELIAAGTVAQRNNRGCWGPVRCW